MYCVLSSCSTMCVKMRSKMWSWRRALTCCWQLATSEPGSRDSLPLTRFIAYKHVHTQARTHTHRLQIGDLADWSDISAHWWFYHQRLGVWLIKCLFIDCGWNDLVPAVGQLWCGCGPSVSGELNHRTKNVSIYSHAYEYRHVQSVCVGIVSTLEQVN